MSVMSLEAIAAAMQDRRAREEEYAVYTALGPIDLDGVRAFNVGDKVPASHIERGIVPLEAVTSDEQEAQEAMRLAGQVTLTRPANSASLADWQAYAMQHPEVIAPEALTDLKRDEIADLFPKEV